MLKRKLMIWHFNFLNMKKIIFIVFMCLSLVANGQTAAISLEEYNDRCTRNEEIIKDVSTIEELFDYFYGLGNDEEVLVVTDEINKIATYKTINRPNKARLYGFVFKYKGGIISHRTIDPIKDMERFIIMLRDQTCPNEAIIFEDKYYCFKYSVNGYEVVYWLSSSKYFDLYRSKQLGIKIAT